jgi:hypothetical protein
MSNENRAGYRVKMDAELVGLAAEAAKAEGLADAEAFIQCVGNDVAKLRILSKLIDKGCPKVLHTQPYIYGKSEERK